jgi:hypothetical protein
MVAHLVKEFLFFVEPKGFNKIFRMMGILWDKAVMPVNEINNLRS